MTETYELDPEVREYMEAVAQKNFGMSMAEYDALTMQQKAQLAYDRGLGFAASPSIAAVGHDGKPVSEQETKVLRPNFPTPTKQDGTQ